MMNTQYTQTLTLALTLALTAACGQTVTHDPYVAEPAPQAETDTRYYGQSDGPTAPTLTAPDQVFPLTVIAMTASATDPEGDAIEYHWAIRDWDNELVAIAKGDSFDFEAPVPPSLDTLEVEVYARDIHGRRGPSTYHEITVNPHVIDIDLADFEVFDYCLENCLIVPQLRDFDFQAHLPSANELLVHYVGAVHDLGWNHFQAQVDFTPDLDAITAGTNVVFTQSMGAEYEPAANLLLGSYAFQISARAQGSLKATFVSWQWQLVDLDSGAVIGSGNLAGVTATNTLSATVTEGAIAVELNGNSLGSFETASMTSTEVGFGVHNTAGTFSNTHITLLP